MKANNYFVLLTDELPVEARFVTFNDRDAEAIRTAWEVVEEVRAHADNPARWCRVGVWAHDRLPRGPWQTARPLV